jgi:hypothetical protein
MIDLMDPVQNIARTVDSIEEIDVVDGVLYFNGEEVQSALASRILDIVEEGLPVEPWVAFAKNVYANPAQFSRDELYLFLEKADLPITEDGCFLAYKNVNDNYRDIYSGKFDNSVGSVCEMPRFMVDQNRNNTCSVGLHFASKDYLPFYRGGGGHTMVVKINPADVVSIPSDYDNTKGRTWRYEVVGEIPFEQVELYDWPAIFNDDDLADEDWWMDEYEDEDEDEVETDDLDNNSKKTYTNPIANGFINWFKR